jgi:hypothetical protein
MTKDNPRPYQREFGQIYSGDVTEPYALPDFADALVTSLLAEYSRVYRNHFHDECPVYSGFYRPDTPGADGEYLHTPGLVVRSFWPGDLYARRHPEVEPLTGEAEKANIEFGDVRIHWFKTPGRGMSTNVSWEPAQWVAWHDAAIVIIRNADVTY